MSNQIINLVMEFFEGWGHVSIDTKSLIIINSCHVLFQLVLESVHYSIFDVGKLSVKRICTLLHLIKVILNFLNL